MARYVSVQNQLIGLFESGTYANASGNFWTGLVQSHNITPSEGTFAVKYMGGVGRDVNVHVQGAKLWEGELVQYPQHFRFLAWALGSNVDAGSPSPYTHLITAIGNDVQTAFTSGAVNPFLSFGIEEVNPTPGDGTNQGYRVKGCIVNEWELAGAQGEILTETVRYFGTSGTSISGTIATINNFNYGTSAIGSITDRPYIFGDVSLEIPGGTVWSPMTDFSLKVRNNLVNRHYLTGSRDATAPAPTLREIMLDLGMDGHSENMGSIYRTFYEGGSDFNAALRVNASTGSRENYIFLSGCRVLDPLEMPFGLEGINPWTIHLQAKGITGSIADLLQRYNPY